MLYRVAYLKVCPRCGLHATIALPDGSESEEFASTKQGLDEVAHLRALGKIADDEAAFLREQVANTELAGIDMPRLFIRTSANLSLEDMPVATATLQ